MIAMLLFKSAGIMNRPNFKLMDVGAIVNLITGNSFRIRVKNDVNSMNHR